MGMLGNVLLMKICLLSFDSKLLSQLANQDSKWYITSSHISDLLALASQKETQILNR